MEKSKNQELHVDKVKAITRNILYIVNLIDSLKVKCTIVFYIDIENVICILYNFVHKKNISVCVILSRWWYEIIEKPILFLNILFNLKCMSIRIATLNANGLGDYSKQNAIFNWCQKQNCLICLQETHYEYYLVKMAKGMERELFLK